MKSQWTLGLLVGVCACGQEPFLEGDSTDGGESGAIEGTGARWEPSDPEDPEPPAPDADPECEARWLEPREPNVIVDAEFSCRISGFGRYGLSVASLDDTAMVTLADSNREWVVRVGAEAIEPLRGGPERLDQHIHTTVDGNGELLVSTVSYVAGGYLWEVWRVGPQWEQLVATEVGHGSRVTGLDATATGEIAAWLELDGSPIVARASTGWAFEPALDLEGAVPTARALSPEGREVVVGHTTDPDTGLAQSFGRVGGSKTVPLDEPGDANVELLLLAPTQGRVFPRDAPAHRAVRGTLGDLGASSIDGWTSLPGAEMASARCRFDWNNVFVDEGCEDCWEQGAGRFGQAVSVARTTEGDLFVAYLHADVDRHYQYNYWCTHPDGDFCSCETYVWDSGSTFGLRLVVVRDDASVSTLLSLPLDVDPDGHELSGPGDSLALDVRGDRAAIAVKLGSAPARAIVVDLSGIDGFAGDGQSR